MRGRRMSINVLAQLDPSGKDPKENKEETRQEIEDRLVSDVRTNIHAIKQNLEILKDDTEAFKQYSNDALMAFKLGCTYSRLKDQVEELEKNSDSLIELMDEPNG